MEIEMKIAYCSLLLPEEKKLSERSKVRLSGISNHKVTIAEIKGIEDNLKDNVDIINIINTVNYPDFPQIIFRNELWNHTQCKEHIDYHVGYINLCGIKYITQFFNTYKKLDKWIKKQDNKKDILICVHNIYLPMMLAVYKLKKKYGIKTCLNTGDLPSVYGLKSQYKKNFKQFIIENVVDKKIMQIAKEFDSFVFVTEPMAEAFHVKNKPHVVVECAYVPTDYKDINVIKNDNYKTVFYAGSIREEYGISHLLRAFSLIKSKEYRLVIAGGGAAENIVRDYAKKDNRISFLGFIPPKEVKRQQLQSTVLVSPRQAKLDFVKYSFPSKSVDSLASGIPYIAHRLPCDPPEYEKYINYTTDESDESLMNKIVEICELSQEDRDNIGEKAQNFILVEKKPELVTKRIVEMWKHLFEATL